MKIKTIITDTEIKVQSYYNSEFVSKARALRGKWSDPFWVFDPNIESHVLNAVESCYGVNGLDDYETCIVTVKLDESGDRSGVEVFGRPIAKAWGRDSGAKLADNIFCIEGDYSSGGSVKNWSTIVSGTFEIHNFPKPSLEMEEVIKAIDEGWAWVRELKTNKPQDDRIGSNLQLAIKKLESLRDGTLQVHNNPQAEALDDVLALLDNPVEVPELKGKYTLEYARELARDHCPALYDEYFIKGFMMAVQVNAVSDLVGALIQVRKHGLIEKDGYESTVKRVNEALKKHGL